MVVVKVRPICILHMEALPMLTMVVVWCAGAGHMATKVCVTVPALRSYLNKWGSANGAGLLLGDSIPQRWLQPQCVSSAEPHATAIAAAAKTPRGDDEFGDDEFGMDDEFGDDWEDSYDGDDIDGSVGAGDTYEGGSSGDGELAKPDKLIGKGTVAVTHGISLETLAQETGLFFLKLKEVESQLYHARQTKLFINYAANMKLFKAERFDDLDTNHDKTLDRSELEEGIRSFGVDWLLPIPYVGWAVIDYVPCSWYPFARDQQSEGNRHGR